MRPVARFIVLIVAVAALPVLARAQEPAGVFDSAAASRARFQAERAAAAGDWPAATRLMEGAYRTDPSLANEFNLATTYARAGEINLAIPLYMDVAKKGQFTSARAIFDRKDQDPKAPKASFNYSDEALRRIALLTDQAYPMDH